MARLLVALTAVIATDSAIPQPKSIDSFGSWRIVGGQNADDEQFPYIVSIRSYNQHMCGGSIIDPEWILTAAHCLDGASKKGLTVVAGSNKLNQGGQSYKVLNTFVHEKWDRHKIFNDIGLIKLSTPIKYSSKVSRIPLAAHSVGENQKAVLSGWGTTLFPGSTPNDLQFINLVTISNSVCGSRHNTHRIYESQVCTFTTRGQGVCHGDSGGPLVVGEEQIGIVSWGRPCAVGYPDVFTRVSYYEDWLRTTMRN